MKAGTQYLFKYMWALLIPTLGLATLRFPQAPTIMVAFVGLLLLAEPFLYWASLQPARKSALAVRQDKMTSGEKLAKRLLLNLHLLLWMAAVVVLFLTFSRSVGWSAGFAGLALLICFGQAEILGHELAHTRGCRPQTFILYSLMGGYDGIRYHLTHHHRLYATTQDELSLYFDEPFFGIQKRIRAQLSTTWRRTPGSLVASYFILVGTWSTVWIFFGLPTASLYLAGITLGRVVAESLSVFSHYRMMRHQGSRFQPVSWDVSCLSLVDFFGGYGITRHSSHHISEGSRPNYVVGSPLLPGFLTMGILCFLCPPLFRKIMDRGLTKWRAKGPALGPVSNDERKSELLRATENSLISHL